MLGRRSPAYLAASTTVVDGWSLRRSDTLPARSAYGPVQSSDRFPNHLPLTPLERPGNLGTLLDRLARHPHGQLRVLTRRFSLEPCGRPSPFSWRRCVHAAGTAGGTSPRFRRRAASDFEHRHSIAAWRTVRQLLTIAVSQAQPISFRGVKRKEPRSSQERARSRNGSCVTSPGRFPFSRLHDAIDVLQQRVD